MEDYKCDVDNNLVAHRICLGELWNSKMEDLPEWCLEELRCIYVLINKVNWKKYVGQTSNFTARWLGTSNLRGFCHRSDYCNNINNHRYNSIRKYGLGNFDVVILNDPNPDIMSSDDLDELEIFWIDYFHSYKYRSDNNCWGYNETSGGSNISPVMREAANTPEARKKKSESLKNYKRTEEHSANISKAKKGVPMSESAHNNLVKAMSDPDVRAKISERTTLAMQRPEVRAKHLEAVRGPKSDAQIENSKRLGSSWKGKSRKFKRYLWRTTSGDIVEMAINSARRFHKDWVMIGLADDHQ